MRGDFEDEPPAGGPPFPAGAGEPGERADLPGSPEAGGIGDAPRAGPPVEITYYTDPLCPWSWAFEPQWRRLLFEFGGQLACRYVMGGMIADWRTYRDPLNAVHNPSQMGAQWYQVGRVSGMPLADRVWREDPPASSFPPCLAVKAAERQGGDVGEAYLRRLREAAMLGGRNIARGEVILSAAEGLAGDPAVGVGLDLDRFRDDLVGPAVADAFREDLREVRDREVGRFPALAFRAGDGPGILLVGHRPYSNLLAALARVAPEARPLRDAADLRSYVSYWGRVTAREAAEALGLEEEAALRALGEAEAAGAIGRDAALPGCYRIPEG